MSQAALVAKRLTAAGGDDAARIRNAYRLLFGRNAKDAEVNLGLDFLKEAELSPWQQYAQALLSSGSFYYVN